METYSAKNAKDIAELWADKGTVKRAVTRFAEATGLPYRTVTGYISRGYFPVSSWERILEAARRDKKKVAQEKPGGKSVNVPVTPDLLYSIWLKNT